MMKDLLNIIRKPSPQRMASTLLEETQRTLLEVSGSREYYTAMERMLIERIERLRYEIKQHLKEPDNEEDFSGRRFDGGLTD